MTEPLAQAIRENSREGVTVWAIENKISLYADADVLITLKTQNSIPVLMNILDKYRNYSGYTLSIQKPQVLTFHFTPSRTVMEKHCFNWHQSQIKYLGVSRTKILSQLYDANNKNIIKKIYEYLGRWGVLPLDFGRRIRSIKMNVLPRLLYLFTALPIEIPSAQLRPLVCCCKPSYQAKWKDTELVSQF